MFEIGAALRDARERQGLDLAQCEARTRIRAKYLRAMEEERFELLPGAAYVKGFLRAYASVLGLDGQVLVDEYTLRFEPPPEPVAPDLPSVTRPRPAERIWPMGRRPQPRRRSEAQLLWLGIGGALAVALLVWVGADDGERATPLPVAPSVTVTVPAPPAAPPPATAPAATAPHATAPAATAPAIAPLASPVRRVVLTATGVPGTEGSYLLVRRGGPEGKVLFEGTVPPGATQTFTAPRRLWVRVGWTPGIRLRVGGREASTPVGTLNFLVTPDGLRLAAEQTS